MTQIELYSGATSFSDPGDWGTPNSVECVGKGGNGDYAGSGGGGGYAYRTNIKPTFPVEVNIVAAARFGPSPGYFVRAGAGGNATGNTGGTGGGFDPLGFDGGSGVGPNAGFPQVGGGGAGGPLGAGSNGFSTPYNSPTGGAGNGGNSPGVSNNGQASSVDANSPFSTGWNVGSGGPGVASYPAGMRNGGTHGGGAGGSSGPGISPSGQGGSGIIVIVYEPPVPPAPGSTWAFPSAALPTPHQARYDGGYSLGFRFISTVDGHVLESGIYAHANNPGPIIFGIWDPSNGQRLGTATLHPSGATGWQSAAHNPPVPIEANKYYVASWSSTQSHQGWYQLYGVPIFPVTDGPLTANMGMWKQGNEMMPEDFDASDPEWFGNDILFRVAGGDASTATIIG